MSNTMYRMMSVYYHYIPSMRDSVMYPLCVLAISVLGDMYAEALSWHVIADYVASLAILPLTVMICDYVPPHISENYTLFTNPGIKRIVKICIFVLVASGCMLLVYLLLPGIFYKDAVVQAPDNVERVARLMGEVVQSIKFLP